MLKIKEGVYSVGVLNPALRVFDIVMETAYGTSYNAYLVVGKEKTALVETCHKIFFGQFLKNIQEIVPVESIDYIILNHNEPDHSGALASLMDFNPDLEIITSQAGSLYLKNITNRSDLKVRVAKDGETLDLGDKTLRFVTAPFLHWPDSMFTYLEEDKLVFSCDFLGAHYCEPYMVDTEILYPKKYEEGFRGYYDAIFGPFKPYVLKGLEKLEALEIETVCPSHGPILTKGCRLEYVKDCYRTWSQPHVNTVKTIPIFYTTAYGNTAQIGEAIREGILEVFPEGDVPLYDIIEHDMAMLSEKLNTCDAFAIGSPTINREAVPPMWVLLSHVDCINCQKKPALVFGSYGWSGEAVPNLSIRLASMKMSVFGEGLKVCFVPSPEELVKAKELGRQFAESLK